MATAVAKARGFTRTFAPVYTGSTWRTVFRAMFEMAAKRSNNAPGPPLTNAEVASFVREWRDVSGSDGPLWHHFAATAYGWDAPTSTSLRRDALQGRGGYPVDEVVDVWEWARGIATELDARGGQPPRIAIDRDTFESPVFAGEVAAALAADGYAPAFKIPTGTCRDKRGKQRAPLPPCDKHGRGLLLGYKSGKPVYAPCDKPGDCAPVLVDDPATVVKKQATSVGQLALLIFGAWVLFNNQAPRRRTRSR